MNRTRAHRSRQVRPVTRLHQPIGYGVRSDRTWKTSNPFDVDFQESLESAIVLAVQEVLNGSSEIHFETRACGYIGGQTTVVTPAIRRSAQQFMTAMVELQKQFRLY